MTLADKLVRKSVRLQVLDKEDFYITLNKDSFEAIIKKAGSDMSAEWKIVPGLDGRGVSFESSQSPGHFLRQQKHRLRVHMYHKSLAFLKDASFALRMVDSEITGTDLVSLESIACPRFFIRHKNSVLRLERKSADESFKKSSVFKLVIAEDGVDLKDETKEDIDVLNRFAFGRLTYRLFSLKHPYHNIAIDIIGDACLFKYPGSHMNEWKAQKGLSGKGISFESVRSSNSYLCCQDSRLKLIPNDDTSLFAEEATFMVRKALADTGALEEYVSFESVSSPGSFICQKKHDLWIEPKVNDQEFKEDASFKPSPASGGFY
jgi:hypothetical protein